MKLVQITIYRSHWNHLYSRRVVLLLSLVPDTEWSLRRLHIYNTWCSGMCMWLKAILHLCTLLPLAAYASSGNLTRTIRYVWQQYSLWLLSLPARYCLVPIQVCVCLSTVIFWCSILYSLFCCSMLFSVVLCFQCVRYHHHYQLLTLHCHHLGPGELVSSDWLFIRYKCYVIYRRWIITDKKYMNIIFNQSIQLHIW